MSYRRKALTFEQYEQCRLARPASGRNATASTGKWQREKGHEHDNSRGSQPAVDSTFHEGDSGGHRRGSHRPLHVLERLHREGTPNTRSLQSCTQQLSRRTQSDAATTVLTITQRRDPLGGCADDAYSPLADETDTGTPGPMLRRWRAGRRARVVDPQGRGHGRTSLRGITRGAGASVDGCARQ